MNRPMLCLAALALIIENTSEGQVMRGGTSRTPRVTAAPVRTVMVPPGDTVVLTPVYPIHYPSPIYITPPLYGSYVPGYYLPAAYYQAAPVATTVSSAQAQALAPAPVTGALTVRQATGTGAAGAPSASAPVQQTTRVETTEQRQTTTQNLPATEVSEK